MSEIKIPTAVIHEIKSTDYIAGISSQIPFEIRLESGDWTPYARTKERQYPPESFCCVSFSANHAIDIQINRFIEQKVLPLRTLTFLSEKGYLDDFGNFNSSDIFTAILSGTTKKGNSQQDVLDSMDDVGLIPEKMLPFGNYPTWEQLTNPKRVTPEMKALGQEFRKYFEVSYEWVKLYGDGKKAISVFKTELKHAPIQITAPVCDGWSQEIPRTCGLTVPQHATLVLKVDDKYFYILDQYEPFFKKLPKDYPVLYGMKIVLDYTRTVTNPETKKELPNYPLDAPLPPLTNDSWLVKLWHTKLFYYFVNKFKSVGALFTKK